MTNNLKRTPFASSQFIGHSQYQIMKMQNISRKRAVNYLFKNVFGARSDFWLSFQWSQICKSVLVALTQCQNIDYLRIYNFSRFEYEMCKLR